MVQKNSIVFRFQDLTQIKFTFVAPTLKEDRDAVAEYIIDMLGRRKSLVNSNFGKHIKKSNVISHRKLEMDFYIGGRLVDTLLSDVVISNKICTDKEALATAIETLFMGHTQLEESAPLVASMN